MMMAACYANYDMSLSHSLPSQHAHHMHQQEQSQQQQQEQQMQQQLQSQHRISSVAELLAAASSSLVAQQKDYSVPLHVDCSVEYELPNQPKPPAGQRVEPLLMIHPCYFRKMESQRRSPFINNMPNSSRNSALMLSTSSSSASTSSSSSTSTRRSSRQLQQQVLTNSSSLPNQDQSYHSQSLHSVQNQNNVINQQIHQQQITQQTRYPVISSIQSHHQTNLTSASNSDYSERTVRRASIIQTRAVNQQYQQQQHQKQQQQLPQWDKIASTSLGMISSMGASQSTTSHSLSTVPTLNLGKQSNYTKSVGKRDAMISGECNNIMTNNTNNCTNTNSNINTNRSNFSNQNNISSNSNNNNSNNSCNNNSKTINNINNNIINSNNNNSNNNLSSNNNNNNINHNNNNINNNNNSNNNNIKNNINNINRINNNLVKINNSASCTSLIDSATNLRMWDASNSLIVHRSPMATVPSNYQAGPETTSTSLINNAAYNSSSSSSLALLNRNMDNDKISGKYRQYLKTHRIHPYLMSNSSNIGTTYSQLASVTNFPHHQQMQQMSCYNV